MTKKEYAIKWALQIASDDSHGYDQGGRWGPDYDCSSLVISAYENAGVPVKTNGASTTRDMRKVFLRTGFSVISNFNTGSYENLLPGDVLLKDGSHTAMYIGNGQIVHASINEYGKILGGRTGDQTGKEIFVRSYYSHPWSVALRYTSDEESDSTFPLNDQTASNIALSGMYTNIASSLDYTQISPYIATIDRRTDDIDFKKLKENKVVAVMIEAGYLYDETHTEVDRYRNPKIDTQVQSAIDVELPFAIYAVVRANDVGEAEKELKQLRILVQKYVPPLGVWLSLNFKSTNTAKNDEIISKYKSRLDKLGLVGKSGFYVTRDQLDTITWSKWQDTMYLWLIEHVSDVSNLNQILTPEFFMLDESAIVSDITASTDGTIYVQQESVPTNGTVVTIPSNIKQTGIIANYTNYSYWYSRWARSSVQRKIADIWDSQGRPSNRNIATISGHYLMATTKTFGTTGDLVTVYLEDNTTFTAILADIKEAGTTSIWGHSFSNSIDIIEWEMKGTTASAVDKNTKIDLTGWKGKAVSKMINHGKFELLK